MSHWLTRTADDRERYTRNFADPDRLSKTLVIERDGVVVGDLMLLVEDAWAQTEVADRARGTQAELGWVIDPAHAGQGYATEAATALLRICFEDLGLRRVIAQCFADNVASWRLMEKLGMRRETHTVRESLHRSGRGSTATPTRCSPRSGARSPDRSRRAGEPPGPVRTRGSAAGAAS